MYAAVLKLRASSRTPKSLPEGLGKPPRDEEGPLRLQKPKKLGKGGSRGLFSAFQKAGTTSVVLLEDAESGSRFAPSSEASGTLPPGLGKPAKDEEGHFKARRKALKGSKKPQKSKTQNPINNLSISPVP